MDKYLENDPYRAFIYTRTYSRWIEEQNRRETWEESVDRYLAFMRENLGAKLTEDEYSEIREYVLWQKVMPSMRLLWSAGAPARRTNATAYNCSFIAPQNFQDFGEILYLLTCGCGVGFTVESHVVDKLPEVKKRWMEKFIAHSLHVVDDSREGWANALVLGMTKWYNGEDVVFDYSKVRPAGARLKTMGGRASGPEPLKGLLDFTKKTILLRQGEKLRPIDVHDIICKIGDIVVMGGVRRSSEISLSDLSDPEMRTAKFGEFWKNEPQRQMANNSVAYKTKPTQQEFMEEWLSLMKSGSGERGIFNRAGLEKQMPKRRWEKLGDHFATTGTNPCGEITLRSKEFCNLTEVVARAEDTLETLLDKIRIATILGTYQSSLTNLPYLSEEWKKNCDEDRLLGVSITGQYDCPVVRNPDVLTSLRLKAISINQEYAERFGISPSSSITCVKPSGTVSQLVNASSGMHPRHAPYYIRRVRITNTDPLFHLMRDAGVSFKQDNEATMVLEFPTKAPDGAITRHDVNALSQLEHWKMLKENYTEHNPSCTVYIAEDEWIAVADWLWKNWDIIGGLSFLPKNEHVYKNAPYEDITKEQYEEMVSKFPTIDYSKLPSYEYEDSTQGSQELACSAGGCDIDLTPEELEKVKQ